VLQTSTRRLPERENGSRAYDDADRRVRSTRRQSFADRRPERIVWPDRQWEWASLRFEEGDFNTAYYLDTTAHEKWFYQAIGASPAMFRRDTRQALFTGSACVIRRGTHLDVGKMYKLSVPLPVPGKLFRSVTVYDIETRS
jgi:hypothetical protein